MQHNIAEKASHDDDATAVLNEEDSLSAISPKFFIALLFSSGRLF